MDKTNHKVVKVNGALLSSDLAVSGMTKDILLDKIAKSGGEVVPSKSTLRRAEQGEFIPYEMLKAIADGLGFPVDKYVMEHREVVKVNGVLLSSDLEARSMTKDALLGKIADSVEVVPSRSTLRRAERGEVIQYEMLKAIAGGLGLPVDRYIVEHSELEASTTCDIAGMWEGFYIEPDADARPSIVESEMQIVQHGANLFIYHNDAEEHGDERTDDVLEACVIRDLVMIKSKVGGWTPPFGVSNSQLKLKNGDDVLSGYSIWYDLDTEEIECSKAVYVRASSQYRDAYLEKAKNMMLEEKERLIKRQ